MRNVDGSLSDHRPTFGRHGDWMTFGNESERKNGKHLTDEDVVVPEKGGQRRTEQAVRETFAAQMTPTIQQPWHFISGSASPPKPLLSTAPRRFPTPRYHRTTTPDRLFGFIRSMFHDPGRPRHL